MAGGIKFMLRKIIVLTVMMLLLLHGFAFAQAGRIILEDILYGVAIGGLLGGAVYLLDQEDFSKKLGIGVGVGAIGGFVFGVVEAGSLAQVEDGEVKVALPAVLIEKRDEATVYSASLFKIKF
jgi:O-antigen ligase